MKKVLLVITLSMLPVLAVALTPIRLALDWYVNPDHAPILVGIQKGYFARQGLKIKLVTPTNDTQPIQLLAAGKVDLAVDYETYLIRQLAAGMPLVWVSNIFPQPMACVAVLASSGITHLSQLRGRNIGSGSGNADMIVRAMLQHAGLHMNDVHMVAIDMDLMQALLGRRVTAATGLMRNVEPVTMRVRGVKLHLFYPEHYGVPNYAELIVVAKRGRVSPAILKHFNLALQAATDDLRHHPQQDWQIVSHAYHDSLAPTVQMAKVNHAIWMDTVRYFAHNVANINHVGFIRLVKFFRQHGWLKERVPAPWL